MSKQFLCILAAGAVTISSAIIVDDLTHVDGNAQSLANRFIGGEGITIIGDASMTATDKSIGIYTNATVESRGNVNLVNGIVLSTGFIESLNSNKNLYDDVTEYLNLPKNDKDLLSLLPDIDPKTGEVPLIYDATILSLDFTSADDGIASFWYVFGSDEYDEWVYDFNDVFGFFLDGKNIATLPGTDIPVSINNINYELNTGLYNRNDLNYYTDGNVPFATEMDGFTKPLSVRFGVNAGQQYHLKMAIGDEGDRRFDSWVLLGEHSFTVTPYTQNVPEPGTVSLIIIGFSLLTSMAWRKRS
jgi:hypothetical protein